MGKVFPIVTDTACRMKWAASTVYLPTGHTASCHRASTGEINKENFFDFHNLPNKQQARQTMLDGAWPGEGCEYCKNIEDAGGSSDRNFQNLVPNVYPHELDKDPTLTAVVPSVLEIFFQNTCNLSCIYCAEAFSSQIQKENLQFGGPMLHEIRDITPGNKSAELTPLMWQWLDKNFDSLHRLQILGGEPLLQPEFNDLIDFIDAHPNPKLELNFVTNLNIKPKNLQNVVDRLTKLHSENKIKRVDILCSVDCWGESQEYIRHGFNSDLFASNFEILRNVECIRLGIISTVTSLSILDMPALAKKYQQWCETKEVFWYMHFVLPVNTHVLSPSAFDYSLYKDALEETVDCITLNTFDANSTRDTLNGIMATLSNSTSNKDMQQNLISYLNTVDSRRNLNWRKTFPWLEKVINNVV